MKNAATELKIALLLDPAGLANQEGIFHSFHIKKSAASIDFDKHKISKEEVNKYFNFLPEAAKETILRFNDGDIRFELSQIKKNYSKHKSGAPLETAARKALLRYLHELFGSLYPYSSQLKFYHYTSQAETGKLRLSPCKLWDTEMSLHFDLVKSSDELFVVPFLTIGSIQYNISDFNRHEFLLQKQDDYFRLAYNDYHILEWLASKKPEQYSNQPAELLRAIVTRLEETHAVNRNGLFSKTEIRCKPIFCLHLSEISGSFLMLTPRWNYDDIIVEGEYKAEYETNRNGELFCIYRDEAAENEFIEFLRSLHPNFSKQQQNNYFYLSFADAAKKSWFLKVYHQLLEMDVTISGMDMLQHFRYSPHPVETDMRIIKTEGSMMHLSFKVSFGKENVLLTELQKLLLSGQRNILLKDNSIGMLTDEWLDQYSAILKHGKVQKDMISVPQWILLSIKENTDSQKQAQPVISREWWDKWRRWQDVSDIVYPVPLQLKATLRNYQHKGFEWMALLAEIGAGACLADDMGLGKTLQTICYLAYLYDKNPKARFLIVCPASLIYNWKQELEKFAPHINIFLYHNNQRDPEQFFNSGAQVMVSSYGTVRADIEQLILTRWEAVVVDESQNIKNPSAQITKAVSMLQTGSRIALSGTPVMNNTFDLYAQLEFLLPGFFGSQEFFRREYAHPIDRENDEIKIKALQQLTAPFILRRTKQQVASDLPPKTESVLWCEMNTTQRDIYEQIKGQIKDSLFLNIKAEGLAQNKLNILQGIQKLRQVCCAPVLMKDEEFPQKDSIKAELLIQELCTKLVDNKVLIFSQFKGMLHLIAAQCRANNISYYHFDGDTPVPQRQQMVNDFQAEDNKVNVFLISLKSGNAGLNLTAADYVFLVDPWWNTAVQQQAIDRTHRIGQTKNVFAYKMICKDTIEEKIIELQQRKQSLSEGLIGEDEGFVKNLSEDDVAYLFA